MGSLKGSMSAYDAMTGQIVWVFNENDAIQSQVNAVGDNVFYGTQSGRLYSRHYMTGVLNYSIDLGSPIESQSAFYKGRLIVHLRDHTIVNLDAETGKVFWRYQRSIPYVTTLQRVSQVMPFENSLIVGFADGYLVSLSLEEGVVNWEQRLSTGVKFVDVDVKPVYFQGSIIAGSAAGPMRMVNPKTGAIEKTIDIYQGHSPLIEGNELIVGSVYGKIYRLDKYGKVINSKKLSDNGISSIISWKDGLVVTFMGEEVLYVNPKDFDTISEFHLGHDQSSIFGSAVVSQDGLLSFFSSRNRLYVFK